MALQCPICEGAVEEVHFQDGGVAFYCHRCCVFLRRRLTLPTCPACGGRPVKAGGAPSFWRCSKCGADCTKEVLSHLGRPP